MRITQRRGGLALAFAFTVLLWTSGCVVQDTPEKIAQIEETNDPFEPTNRYFFEVNRFLDEFGFKPLAAWYNAALPQPVQDAVHKFVANLSQPWTAINDFLQGNPERAGEALARFAINTTVGVAGLFDVATGWGFPEHSEDLGQTMAVMGAPEGPYLVLPFFGPSNPRDAIGMAGDFFLDPVNIVVTNTSVPKHVHPFSPHHQRLTWFPSARVFADGVDERNRYDQALRDLEKQSIDFYATIRSVYRQRRDAQIHNRGEGEETYPRPKMSVAPAGAHPYIPPKRAAAPEQTPSDQHVD